MSDVSGIPYMGPMGVGNLFAPLYPALSGGGNMSAGQISAPYAGPSAYNQSILNNLYSSGGGFGAQTDYYSQLAANQLSALTPNTFAQAPSYNYGSLYGGGDAAPPPSAYDYTSLYGGGGGGFGGGGFGGGLGGGGGGGGFSGYDYGSLYGGGGAAAPPSSYGYGSLYSPPAAPDPLSYQSMYSGSGGLFQGGFPNAGGYQMPSSQRLLGYDPNAANLGGGGGGGAPAYDYGSLYGGGGGSISDRLIQTLRGGDSGGWGNAPGAMPDMQRLLGYNPPSQYDFPAPPIQPQSMGYDYGSLYGGGAAATSPSSYGYGSLGGGGSIYDPFNVGGRLDPALYGPGGLGGGGGIGQAPAAMPDIQRLLGYNPRQLSALPDRSGIDFRTPDVQGGIDSLQQTLDLIDRTTGGGYTLSPQDRDIPFRGPGGGSAGASRYADEGPFAGFGLPPEITQGGSIPSADPYSGFTRNLFGNAPAYPAGVVTGPYALPDITPQRAQDPFGGGGPFPFTSEDPRADFGLPPEITQGRSTPGGALSFAMPGGLDQPMAPRSPQPYFDEPVAGYGGASMPQQQQSYFDEPVAGYGGAQMPAFDPAIFQSPGNDYRTFQQGPSRPLGVSPDIAKYYLQDPRMNANQRAAFEAFPGRFTPEDQQRQLQDDRAALAAQLENNPDTMRRLAAMAKSEVGNVSDEQILAFLETPFNKYASKGWDAFQTGITTKQGLASPLASPGTPGSYYEPARSGGTLQDSLNAMRDDPALLAKYTDLIRQVAHGGTNLSGIGTENASIGVAMGPDGYPMITGTGRRDMGGKALATQTLGGWAPDVPGGMEVFTRKDLPHDVHGGPGTRPLADWAYNRSPWQNFSDWYNTTNPAQNVPWEQTWKR